MEENVNTTYSNESEKTAIDAFFNVLNNMSEDEDYIDDSEDEIEDTYDVSESESSSESGISEEGDVDFSDIF